MDIEKIKAEAPENAAFWSPVVGQYFTLQFMSLAPAFKGKLIQVDEDFRGELIPLTKLRG
ncbi:MULTISPECIES: hypothetical protein [Vibrio]|uniref:hypothetical protein n=1 Tax=Vibrio TaxID=662 RepID=UPI0008421DDB|nr:MULTISPECIES: hypothetical protein [Vibrio]ODM57059.1 hypothetical protein BC455_18120 [Vibrio harveyi]USD58648.1 hypothetical protein J4N44_27230 [Vibrio sp. SCSIO 43155]